MATGKMLIFALSQDGWYQSPGISGHPECVGLCGDRMLSTRFQNDFLVVRESSADHD